MTVYIIFLLKIDRVITYLYILELKIMHQTTCTNVAAHAVRARVHVTTRLHNALNNWFNMFTSSAASHFRHFLQNDALLLLVLLLCYSRKLQKLVKLFQLLNILRL